MKTVWLLDQVGCGSGDLLYGLVPTNAVTGLPNWPDETNEMVYAWSNTFNASLTAIGSSYPKILEGRDFTNNLVKPDYTPFTYPHPLNK